MKLSSVLPALVTVLAVVTLRTCDAQEKRNPEEVKRIGVVAYYTVKGMNIIYPDIITKITKADTEMITVKMEILDKVGMPKIEVEADFPIEMLAEELTEGGEKQLFEFLMTTFKFNMAASGIDNFLARKEDVRKL